MEAVALKTNLHCSSCVEKIEPILKAESTIEKFDINLSHPDKLVTIKGSDIDVNNIIQQFSEAGYDAKPSAEAQEFHFPEIKSGKENFWKSKHNWKRASFNTLNCLIGCSIGDFGMLIYLQAYHPQTSMLLQMILAIIAGLITSIILETIILRKREKFNWNLALKTAFSMSFISMIGMEIAMNSTDFMITGGKAAFDTVKYWFALIPALVAGFLLPLPYNYYKLQKFNKYCH